MPVRAVFGYWYLTGMGFGERWYQQLWYIMNMSVPMRSESSFHQLLEFIKGAFLHRRKLSITTGWVRDEMMVRSVGTW
jgi:hypothetical protein